MVFSQSVNGVIIIVINSVKEMRDSLNEKFFSLSEEKQHAIINAGCRGFIKNGYKKSSMSETAVEAGVSKALLFHYFRNKKEYYLYLFDYAIQMTIKISKEEITVLERDFFEIFMQSARIKSRLLKQYPHLSKFMMRAYYEEDCEVAEELRSKTYALTAGSVESILKRIDRSKFKDNVNIEQLVKTVIWCGEGYMKEKYYDSQLSIDVIETGYSEMLDFFRQNCYKEEFLK